MEPGSYSTTQSPIGFLREKGKILSSFRLDLEITERCNNNCIHCYINRPAGDQAAKKRELSTDEIKDILRSVASLNCFTIRFTGGEPLLRDDFEELYIFTRKLGFRVLLFTNATLITPHMADLFVRIPPLREIEVSVYGMKKESYEKVTRVPGSYEAAWRGINLLLERNIPFVVKGAVLPPNRDELKEFNDWASSIPWMDLLPSFSMSYDLRCRRDSEKKNEFIKSLRLSPEDELEIIAKEPEKYRKAVRKFCSSSISPPGDRLIRCGAGRTKFSVDAYGYIQACLLLRHPDTVYNLKEGSIRDAMTNFFPQMRQMRASNPEYLNRCARCFLKGLCEQCPAKSWMEHGTLDTPVEYLCNSAHTKARYVGLLKDNENAWEVENWQERIERISVNI
jgi:radical SAM protein with 4Fe4S-binding SPASM domain